MEQYTKYEERRENTVCLLSMLSGYIKIRVLKKKKVFLSENKVILSHSIHYTSGSRLLTGDGSFAIWPTDPSRPIPDKSIHWILLLIILKHSRLL